MGGIFKGAGSLVSGVANAIPGIGPYVGPVVGGMTGGPLGFATSLAGNALQGNYGGSGSGGSASTYAKPNYDYGGQTYQYNNKPVDTSKYFITGDKGVYNLMPAIGQINAGLDPAKAPWGLSGGTNYKPYTPYQAYQDLSKQMANDPKALAAFQAAYKPTAYGDAARNTNPYIDFGLSGTIGNNATYGDIAKYASTNQNPFYMPYDASGGKISGFTPAPTGMELKRIQAAKRDAAFRQLPAAEREAIMERRALNMQKMLETHNTTGPGLVGLYRRRNEI